MNAPLVIKENAKRFISTHNFDLYIGNPYSSQFIPHEANSIILTHSLYSELPELLKAMPRTNGKILAFGAGSVFDPAKYIAKMTDSDLTVIPTALSVNSFATHRSSFFDGQSKRSMDTLPPKTIILDFEIIKSAGILNTFGVIEIVATATALADWLYAVEKGEAPKNREINDRCVRLIESAIDLLKNESDIPNRLEQVFEGLLESGLLTQEYGNGRPVSGSEHVISSYIENEIIGCAHGAGLYFGILVSAALQTRLKKDTEQVKVVSQLLQVSPTLQAYIRSIFTRKILEPILLKVKPRPDKYTILNEVSSDDMVQAVKEVCDKIFL